MVLDIKYKGKSIKPGFVLPKNSTVEIIVGKGEQQAAQVQVPNLMGKTIKEAKLELSSLSLQLNAQFGEGIVTSTDSSNATIQNQNPEHVEGYTVAEGSEIIVILK